MPEPTFSLADAAAHLGWSRRTLKAKERTRSVALTSVEPRIEPRRVIETMPVGLAMDALDGSDWKRRLGQINRRSPIEKATSPLKLILYFTDLDETARQMDMLQRALEEARPIANDESLNEEPKRASLRRP